MKIQPKYLHTRIREARSAKNMTQKRLAFRIGVTAGAVSQWESEDPETRTVPSLENLMAVAQATGRTMGWFMDGEVEIKPDVATPLSREEKIEALVAMHQRLARIDGNYLTDFFRQYYALYSERMLDEEYEDWIGDEQ